MSEAVILDKLDPVTKFEIWEPRYHDKRVLLHLQRVKHAQPHIKVVFTKAKATQYEGEWYISKKDAMKYKKEDNGVAGMYCVPFDKFRPLIVKDTHKYWM